MYSIEGLERGIEQCQQNIKIFKEAIARERVTMKEYEEMILILKDKEAREKEMAKHVEVVVGGDTQ